MNKTAFSNKLQNKIEIKKKPSLFLHVAINLANKQVALCQHKTWQTESKITAGNKQSKKVVPVNLK